MIVTFTGHRPPKGGLTYSHTAAGDKAAVDATVAWLDEYKPHTAIVGGALGFDTLAARACWIEHVGYVVYVPFVGQEAKWPPAAQDRYHHMLHMAAATVVVSPGGYSARKMQIRNERMVDAADVVVSWWDGSPGGTANCIRYAKSRGKATVNLWQP